MERVLPTSQKITLANNMRGFIIWREEKIVKIMLEKIKFNDELKSKFDDLKDTQSLEITYYNGYITKFDKCNVESISPHKILLSNHTKNLLILHYAEYMENDELYFIDGEKEPFTITKLREYIKKFF